MRFDAEILRECRFLAGPTASGKTAVALVLAERIGGEIIALDSMSLYRGMDIGTAKPSRDEQARVPHHLIDVIDPHEDYSVAEYVSAAGEVCREIVERGRIPLFVGGTGLYLRAVLRGVFEGPAADWEFRRRVERDIDARGPEAVFVELRRIDPASAERLHAHDTRRVIRALEIHHVTGRPASELQQEGPLPVGLRPRFVDWLSPPRDRLHDRINTRVDQMMERGLLDEVRELMDADRSLSRTARQALGYKELIDFLETRCDLAEAVDAIKTRTRQFAKRQCTWFRNLEECTEVSMHGEETAEQLAEILITSPDDRARPRTS